MFNDECRDENIQTLSILNKSIEFAASIIHKLFNFQPQKLTDVSEPSLSFGKDPVDGKPRF